MPAGRRHELAEAVGREPRKPGGARDPGEESRRWVRGRSGGRASLRAAPLSVGTQRAPPARGEGPSQGDGRPGDRPPAATRDEREGGRAATASGSAWKGPGHASQSGRDEFQVPAGYAELCVEDQGTSRKVWNAVRPGTWGGDRTRHVQAAVGAEAACVTRPNQRRVEQFPRMDGIRGQEGHTGPSRGRPRCVGCCRGRGVRAGVRGLSNEGAASNTRSGFREGRGPKSACKARGDARARSADSGSRGRARERGFSGAPSEHPSTLTGSGL